MEELVEAVLAGVADAVSKGKRRYLYVMPPDCCECNMKLEKEVQARLPGYTVNYQTITFHTGRVEKRLVIDW